MGATIDHLAADRRVTVIREFHDATGAHHAAGEAAVIRAISIDWVSRRIRIVWDRDGRPETLEFDLTSLTGPGNGRMREFFDVGELVAERPAPLAVQVLPDPGPELIVDVARCEEAVERVEALASRRRFSEAEEQLQALGAASTDRIASLLGAAAARHAESGDQRVWDWLRVRALDYWYSWGAEATSGGDGTARMLEIRPAVKRLEELDRKRRRASE